MYVLLFHHADRSLQSVAFTIDLEVKFALPAAVKLLCEVWTSKLLHALLHLAQGWAQISTFWSTALPQLSLPGLELRARAPLMAPMCEERPHTLTSSDTYLENDLIPRGQSNFQSVVRQASCHLSIWWKRKHDRLRVRRPGVSCSCVPK